MALRSVWTTLIVAMPLTIAQPITAWAQNCTTNPNAPGCRKSEPPPRPEPEERPAPPPKEEPQRPAPTAREEPQQRPGPEPGRSAPPQREDNNGSAGDYNRNGANRPNTPPATTSTPRTYTPGAPPANNSHAPTIYKPGGSGGTTYTPHVYTPGSPVTSPQPAASDAGVHTGSGTVYTPRAYTPAQPSTARAIATPRRVSKASVSTHAVYFVPSSAVSSRSTTGAITLNASGSAEVLRQVNAARSSLTGINKRPLPSGAVTTHANGSLTVAGSGERVFQVRASGTIAAVTTAHERVAFNVRGHVVAVRTRAMDIYRGPHGVQTVVERRPDHTVLVSTGFGTGYLQRHFTQGGQAFIARTYVSRGAIFTRVYSPYVFHGVQLYHYVPAFTTRPTSTGGHTTAGPAPPILPGAGRASRGMDSTAPTSLQRLSTRAQACG